MLAIRIIQNKLFFDNMTRHIAHGERVRIRAKGNSMFPLIRDAKDELILEKTNQRSFQRGHLLLVQLKDKRYILHRVKKVEGSTILLQGDGNIAAVETCTANDVIAEATTVIRNGKTIKYGSLQWNMYHYLWPSNSFLRRVLLAVYSRGTNLYWALRNAGPTCLFALLLTAHIKNYAQ